MKKAIKSICILLILVFMVSQLSACENAVHNHTFSESWQHNDAMHWREATCGHTMLTSGLAEHDYNGDNVCDVCGYVKPAPITPHEHTFDTEWSMNENSHWHEATCEHTALTNGLAEHDYNGDDVCDVCGYVKPTPITPHEHTFGETWESNDVMHWHEATCEHTALTSDLQLHDFGADGNCTICGHKNPNYTPSPLPTENVYYLPTEVIEYLDDELYGKHTYTYTDDLLGYTETNYNYIDGYTEYTKDVNSFLFNEDYTELTLVKKEYDVVNEVETLTCQRKYEYEFFENSSYKVRFDEYDIEEKEYVFQNILAKYYNERGQKTLEYSLHSDDEGTFYFSYIDVYEYDEEGFIQTATYYSHKIGDENVTYIEGIETYEYSEDKLSSTEKYYYYSENGYYLDSYTDITAEIIGGVRYETQIIYQADGTKGNTNKFGIDENFEYLYINYGGIPMEETITKNEFDQIVRFEHADFVEQFSMDVTYEENGGNIIASVKETSNPMSQITESTTYTYNDKGQLVEVFKQATGDYSWTNKDTITYSNLQNDELLKHFEIYDSILRNFSDNVLVEGLR